PGNPAAQARHLRRERGWRPRRQTRVLRAARHRIPRPEAPARARPARTVEHRLAGLLSPLLTEAVIPLQTGGMRITALTIELTMALGLGALGAQSDMAGELPIAAGPFQPTMQSLTNYHCPKWFRDAKFGIWAHWGPQAAPMDGDWYARQMYQQGSAQYKDHLERYGHPSTNGYKDIIPLWKAEKWDPDRLMALYQKAGARYFVSMGCHHDNFDLWNSKFHKWNAVNMGPQRDVVGDWQKAARKLGLRFGVSEHMGASFTWFQVSHGSDKTGPLAGVKYDGANPKWDELYHFPIK